MKINKLRLLAVCVTLIFTGCAESGHQDIKNWMKEQEKLLVGKIDKLPEAKTFVHIPYEAKINPFVLKEKINLEALLSDKFAPDSNREKESLESVELDTLKMTGTIIKDGKFFAMIKDFNNKINYVKVGNYMGLNYGKIKSISESEILIEERVKIDQNWVLREVTIYLPDVKSKK